MKLRRDCCFSEQSIATFHLGDPEIPIEPSIAGSRYVKIPGVGYRPRDARIPRELISVTPMIAVNWSGRLYQILDACPYVVSQHMAHLIAVPPWQVVGARRVMGAELVVPRGSAWREAADGHRYGTPLVSRRSTNILRALCVCLYLCVPRACPPAQNVVVARVQAGKLAR